MDDAVINKTFITLLVMARASVMVLSFFLFRWKTIWSETKAAGPSVSSILFRGVPACPRAPRWIQMALSATCQPERPLTDERKKNNMTTSPTYTYVSYNRLGWVMSEEFSLLACFFFCFAFDCKCIIKQTGRLYRWVTPFQYKLECSLTHASILTHCNSHPVTASKLIDLTFDSFIQIPVLYYKV